MENPHRILIFTKPGNFRESLVAVLRTLPRSDLFLINDMEWMNEQINFQDTQALLLADMEGIGLESSKSFYHIKDRFPGIRCLALADNSMQIKEARRMRADYVLPRSASAGELLSTIEHLSSGNPRTNERTHTHHQFALPAIR